MIGKIRAVTVEPWIAVTHHLPLQPGRYLVCCAGRDPEVDPVVGSAWYDPEDPDGITWLLDPPNLIHPNQITHWYFMPAFPEPRDGRN